VAGHRPKPYVGHPAYDVLQHMLNCEDRLAADPVGLATGWPA
jgi:streptomycin 6-kinase